MKRLLILEREDLPRDFRELDILNISPRNFSYGPYNMIKESDMVLFKDDDGSMKVIKSRYPMENQNEIF